MEPQAATAENNGVPNWDRVSWSLWLALRYKDIEKGLHITSNSFAKVMSHTIVPWENKSSKYLSLNNYLLNECTVFNHSLRGT